MTSKPKLTWWCESYDFPHNEESGARIRQLTSAPALSTDVYCEQPYCSADGNRLAIHRSFDTSPEAKTQFLVYDITRYRIALLENAVHGIANAAWTGVLFITVPQGDDFRVVRWDLNTLEREELFDWGDMPGNGAFQTISADSRYGLVSQQLDQQRFGVFRIDLHNGKAELIHEGPYLCNTHLQFRLQTSARIMVQENQGCAFDEDWNMVRPFDERGARLYTIAADGGEPHYFPVGKPHTPGTTGHECWVGDTDNLLVTLSKVWHDGTQTGNVLELSHERDQARVVFETPHVWNHISATRCGRYFVVDSYEVPGVPILLGSIKTGKTRVLCLSNTTGGGGQYSHAHPYVTSDNKYVVYNSDRTGLAQVYIASIPDGFLESLD